MFKSKELFNYQRGVKMKKASIFYYTGAGNSAHAAKVLANELKKMKWGVQTIRIRGKADNENLKADLLVFIYPVYALSCPYGFIKYIKSLKNGNGSKTAVIANHGMANLKGGINTGYEGNGPEQARKILIKRNFDVFYTGAVGYPENITLIANAIPDKIAKEIITDADRELIKFKTSIKKYIFFESILSVSFGWLLNKWGRWHIGKLYSADNDCNNCGKCVKSCPAGCIKIFNKKPRWNWNCQACFGCFNICPKKSINVSIARAVLLLAVGFVILCPMIVYFGKIFDFLTVFFQVDVNIIFISNFIYILTSIIVYMAIYLISIYLLEKIIFILEQIPRVKIFFMLTYSKRLKRYFAFSYKNG